MNTLRQAVEEYLSLRRGLGFKLQHAGKDLLDFVTFMEQHRINLLTLHSTKGLEFSRVYVLGVEDNEIPGYQTMTNNITDEIEEARRLLYVGMTRARDRLVLTRVARRFGRDAGGSTFLEEMKLGTSDLRDPNLRPALL